MPWCRAFDTVRLVPLARSVGYALACPVIAWISKQCRQCQELKVAKQFWKVVGFLLLVFYSWWDHLITMSDSHSVPRHLRRWRQPLPPHTSTHASNFTALHRLLHQSAIGAVADTGKRLGQRDRLGNCDDHYYRLPFLGLGCKPRHLTLKKKKKSCAEKGIKLRAYSIFE